VVTDAGRRLDLAGTEKGRRQLLAERKADSRPLAAGEQPLGRARTDVFFHVGCALSIVKGRGRKNLLGVSALWAPLLAGFPRPQDGKAFFVQTHLRARPPSGPDDPARVAALRLSQVFLPRMPRHVRKRGGEGGRSDRTWHRVQPRVAELAR